MIWSFWKKKKKKKKKKKSFLAGCQPARRHCQCGEMEMNFGFGDQQLWSEVFPILADFCDDIVVRERKIPHRNPHWAVAVPMLEVNITLEPRRLQLIRKRSEHLGHHRLGLGPNPRSPACR